MPRGTAFFHTTGEKSGLAGLRGRVVDIGPHDAATEGLAVAVLAFSGVPLADGTATGGVTVRSLELGSFSP